MKNTIILIGLFLGGSLLAQDTFSLCAVDSITGEVGSAGASCLDNIQFPGSQGAIIISDVKPGVGVIHTQSYWIQGNQNNARRRMDAGDNAEEVIGWLVDNDVQNNPTLRQYGAALLDVDGRPSAKAFTGTNCADYKGQHEGLSYTVQGNILLGPEILDSMQARFIREKGDLAAKLMAAMQGANVPGADKRCLNEGVSSLSAFIRVAKPNDDEGNLYLDLNVPSTAFGVEPIDSLQNLYDQWRQTLSSKDLNNVDFKIGPNPFNQNVTLSIDGLSNWKEVAIQVADATGKIVFTKRIKGSKTELSLNDLSKGMFFFTVNVDGEKSTRVLKLIKI